LNSPKKKLTSVTIFFKSTKFSQRSTNHKPNLSKRSMRKSKLERFRNVIKLFLTSRTTTKLFGSRWQKTISNFATRRENY
jgi:hypothetical protein